MDSQCSRRSCHSLFVTVIIFPPKRCCFANKESFNLAQTSAPHSPKRSHPRLGLRMKSISLDSPDTAIEDSSRCDHAVIVARRYQGYTVGRFGATTRGATSFNQQQHMQCNILTPLSYSHAHIPPFIHLHSWLHERRKNPSDIPSVSLY